MSEEDSHYDPHEPSDVRYGTRSLLLAMVAVAVAFTGLSALFRYFPADVRPRLAVFWLILFALLGAFVAYNARRRYLAEKQAGAVRFRLTPHSYFLPRVPAVARVMAGVFLLLCAPVLWVGLSFLVAEDVRTLWTQFLNWQTYFTIFASATGFNYLWWHGKVRVCEEGLVVRHTFVPWSAFRRWYWDACYRDAIVLEYDQRPKVALKVPAEERATVEEFVGVRSLAKPQAAD